MKFIVGLGNTGSSYVSTRHNTGFLAIDELAKSQNPKFKIFKVDGFMNNSGKFVAGLLNKYKFNLNDLYVIHDDLDIPLGSYKIQFGKGPKDHNGLKSIDEALGTDQYWHVRMGVDNRPLDNRTSGETYVLENFSDIEKQKLGDEIRSACKKLETLINNPNKPINQ